MLCLLPLICLLLAPASTYQVLPSFLKRSQSVLGLEAETSPLDESFDTFVKQAMSDSHVPGLAIAVIKDGVTYTKGYGVANALNEEVTPDTLFLASQLAETHTAAAVSLLVDNNQEWPDVQWSTPLSRLMSDSLILQDSHAQQHITLEDALSHRSGMPGHYFALGNESVTVQELLARMRHLPFPKDIRTKFRHSSLMYVAVSYAFETVTGWPLHEFLTAKIWAPLGMTKTFLSLGDALDAEAAGEVRLARGYRWTEPNGLKEERYLNASQLSGATGLITSVVDCAKWIDMMMNTKAPLSKKSHAALTFPRIVAYRKTSFFGWRMSALGWYLETYHGEELVYKNGEAPGFDSKIVYMPNEKFGFALLANANSWVPGQIAMRLMEDYLHVPIEKRYDTVADHKLFLQTRKKIENDPLKAIQDVSPMVPVLHSLPLSSYAGTYFNPAYQTLSINLINGSLEAELHGALQPLQLSLVHVSHEQFVFCEREPGIFPMGGKLMIAGQFQAYNLSEGVGIIRGVSVWFDGDPDVQSIWFPKRY